LHLVRVKSKRDAIGDRLLWVVGAQASTAYLRHVSSQLFYVAPEAQLSGCIRPQELTSQSPSSPLHSSIIKLHHGTVIARFLEALARSRVKKMK
jgi:hypothetical protein